jgi:hypothetical protein
LADGVKEFFAGGKPGFAMGAFKSKRHESEIELFLFL